MPTTITFRRGTAAPTSGSGLTLGEPAFDSSLKRFFIGQGTGVTAVWVGAQISGLSSDIAAGLTYQIPTLGAVKDYVASTTSGVATLNNLTGAITLNAGTAIGVTSASGNITVTNQGVQSFNGLTGAVFGVTTSVANTFTAAQTFNAGITTSTLDVTGQAKFNGNVNFGDASSDNMTVTGVMSVNNGLSASTVDVTNGLTVGGNLYVRGNSQLGDLSTSDTFNVFAGTTFNGTTDFAGIARFASGATFTSRIDSNNGVFFTGAASGTIQTINSALTLQGTTTAAYNPGQGPSRIQLTNTGFTMGSGSGTINVYPTVGSQSAQSKIALWYVDYDGVQFFSTTISPTTPTANRTITLPDDTGTVALTKNVVSSFNGLTGNVGGVCAAQANTFTALQTFNSGLSAGGTITLSSPSLIGTPTAPTAVIGTNSTQIATTAFVQNEIIADTVTTFNGRTGAVQGVSAAIAGTGIFVSGATGSVTITNIGVQSFNGLTGNVFGVTTSTANTFTAAQTFNAGITTSTLDVTGQAKFNGNVNFGDAAADVMTVNGGMTVGSSLDVTGVARFNGNVTIGDAASDVLTVTAGSTFGITDHTGAARFAQTVVVTGALTANGGITASALAVTNGVTIGGNLTVTGNLQVDGTTTTINSTTLQIDDKLIELAHSPSGATGNDAAVNGGGIQLNSTQGSKTFTYNSTTPAWVSSENLDIASGKTYKINATDVLSSTTLGSSVVTSSLTTVGTIGQGVWQGTAVGVTYGGTGLTSYTIGDIIYASNTGTLAKLPASTDGYLLASKGAGVAPEYKQLLVRDAGANSIATVSSGSGTLTATIQYATTTLKGVASFDSTNFSVSSGSVTIIGVDGGSYA